MPHCQIRDIDQPAAESHLGRAEFATLPRLHDLVSFHLPGTGRTLCKVEAVEHIGVHESSDRDATPASAPGVPLPAGEPATLLHVRILQGDHTP